MADKNYYGWKGDDGKFRVSRFAPGAPRRPANEYDTVQAAMTEIGRRGGLIEWDASALPPEPEMIIEQPVVEARPAVVEIDQPVAVEPVVDPLVEELRQLNDKFQQLLDRK